MNGPIYGMNYVDANGELQTWKYQEYERSFRMPQDLLLPIPQDEMDLTNNIEQNPGY